MTDIHAGDAATLISDAPDRPVELLADPTSTEVAVDLYFAIDGSKQTCAGCCTGRPANSHHRPSLRKKQPLSTQGLRNCGPTWSTRRNWEEQHTRSTTLARIHYTLISRHHA